MATVGVDEDVWCDPRFAELQKACVWDRAYTAGVLVLFWQSSRQMRREILTFEELTGCIPIFGDKAVAAVLAMMRCGYVLAIEAAPKEPGRVFCLPDNVPFFRRIKRLKEAASRGGLARAEAKKQRKSTFLRVAKNA